MRPASVESDGKQRMHSRDVGGRTITCWTSPSPALRVGWTSGRPVSGDRPGGNVGLAGCRAHTGSGTDDADGAVAADEERAEVVDVGAHGRAVAGDAAAVDHIQGAGVVDAATLVGDWVAVGVRRVAGDRTRAQG